MLISIKTIVITSINDYNRSTGASLTCSVTSNQIVVQLTDDVYQTLRVLQIGSTASAIFLRYRVIGYEA